MKSVEISKAEALAKFLECEIDDINETKNCFEYRRQEYLVLTDFEADRKAKEDILDSVWAFNYDFLCCHSSAIEEMGSECFKAIQEKGERANKGILAMIDDIDDFVTGAIDSDGRGHFLSSYNGKEDEQEGYYIYRIN